LAVEPEELMARATCCANVATTDRLLQRGRQDVAISAGKRCRWFEIKVDGG
jgi:hypothetical protein